MHTNIGDFMGFINRKDENGNYIISNEELKSLMASLNEKYKLSRANESERIYKLFRDEDGVTCVVGIRIPTYGPFTPIPDECFLTDFDVSSIRVRGEGKINIQKDYRKFMYSKYGDEYLEALKQFKKQEKQQATSDCATEMDEK